jgi:hypothetical protein
MCNYIIAVLLSACALSTLPTNAQNFQLIRKKVEKLNSIPDAKARLLKYHALARRMLLRKFKKAVDSSIDLSGRPPLWKRSKKKIIQHLPAKKNLGDSTLSKIENVGRLLSSHSTVADSLSLSVTDRLLRSLRENINFYFTGKMPVKYGVARLDPPSDQNMNTVFPDIGVTAIPMQDLKKPPISAGIGGDRCITRRLARFEDPASQARDSMDVNEIEKRLIEDAASRFTSCKQFLAGQSAVSKMLSKYSEFSSSADVETAVKRVSLKGRPLQERLYLGFNISPSSFEPFALGVSPQVGFKVNKRFFTGAALNCRMAFGDTTDSKLQRGALAFSYRAFTSLTFKRTYFAYVEAEFSPVQMEKNDALKRSVGTNFAVGLGKRFLVDPRLYFNVVTLYRLNGHDEETFHASRFSVRVGLELSELALRKKRQYYNPNR